MKAYEKINEIRKECETTFNIALGNLITMGYENALKITDEQIEKCKIPMFTDELAKTYAKQLRELARIENEESYSIYKYIQIEKPLSTIGFKPRGKKNG